MEPWFLRHCSGPRARRWARFGEQAFSRRLTPPAILAALEPLIEDVKAEAYKQALRDAAYHYGFIWGTGETTERRVGEVLKHWAEHGVGTHPRHHCEPPYYPSDLHEVWTCPECDLEHRAYDVHAEADKFPDLGREMVLRSVPVGTLGWTTRETGDLSGAGGRVDP